MSLFIQNFPKFIIKMSVQALIKNKEKFDELSKDIFNQYDTNKNGVICESELTAAITRFAEGKGVPIPNAETIKRVYTHLDTNKDGALSLDEFKVFIVKTLLNEPLD